MNTQKPKQPKKAPAPVTKKAETIPFVCVECGSRWELGPDDPRRCQACSEPVVMVEES